MSSKTYIICWDGCLDNCLYIEGQLANSGIDYLFYNVSSTEVELTNWERVDDIRYYRHFHNALKDFSTTEHSAFIFNAGDPVFSDYPNYTRYIEALFELDHRIGLFAPSFDYDTFSGDGSIIRESRKYQNMYLSTMTNGIYLAMSRDVALFTLQFMDWLVDVDGTDLSSMTSGWGLDLAYNSYAIYMEKNIYRDKMEMHHPTGSSYQEDKASSEMALILKKFNEFCEKQGLELDRLIRIQNKTVEKVQKREKLELKYEEFYGIDLE